MASSVIPSEWPQDVGDRFFPKDHELIGHYLRQKMLGNDHLVDHRIPTIDFYMFEPSDLPRCSRAQSNDAEWYFFCPRDLDATRIRRTTKNGYWKSTGKDRNIKDEATGKVFGTKKSLVFHVGRTPNGVRTGWIIHEYSATHNYNQRTFVLIKLMKKSDRNANSLTYNEGEPSADMDNGYAPTHSEEEGGPSSYIGVDSGNQNSYPETGNSATQFTTQESVDFEPLPYMGSFYGGYSVQDYSLNHALEPNIHLEQGFSYNSNNHALEPNIHLEQGFSYNSNGTYPWP